MKYHDEPLLDYSALCGEHQLERAAEAERQKVLAKYNKATFGERRPFGASLIRSVLMVVAGAVALAMLKKGGGSLIGLLIPVAIFGWCWWKEKGWYWQKYRQVDELPSPAPRAADAVLWANDRA